MQLLVITFILYLLKLLAGYGFCLKSLLNIMNWQKIQTMYWKPIKTGSIEILESWNRNCQIAILCGSRPLSQWYPFFRESSVAWQMEGQNLIRQRGRVQLFTCTVVSSANDINQFVTQATRINFRFLSIRVKPVTFLIILALLHLATPQETRGDSQKLVWIPLLCRAVFNQVSQNQNQSNHSS